MRLATILSSAARWSRAVLAAGAVSLLSACDYNFWRMDGHQSTIKVEGPVARSQLEVFYVTCWVTLVIFILVGAVLAYASIKFKARTTAEEKSIPPEQGHGNPLIEIGLIGASILALVVIAIPTLKGIWYTYDVPEDRKADTYEVTATGYQWWFKFDYPSEQIAGAGALATANELVIPAGRPVRVNLRTIDVIHSFWIPKLAGKVDMMPNRANHLWFQADQPGYYWGQCAEFCGDSHAVMRFRVIALGPKDFNDWLSQQTAPARDVAPPRVATQDAPKVQFASLRTFKQNETGHTAKYDISPLDAWKAQQFPEKGESVALIAQGKALFKEKACLSCHEVRGHGYAGISGPSLTHFGSRSTLAGALLENNTEQLHRWIHNPESVKAGNKMAKGYIDNNIKLTTEDEVALVAYLQSLK
ncbi:MAG: cytochrome c oxidase subunit II [Opitutia bacterium]|nr:MAG: cytochrome c oxidase subunit II [Opitutae bacterium]